MGKGLSVPARSRRPYFVGVVFKPRLMVRTGICTTQKQEGCEKEKQVESQNSKDWILLKNPFMDDGKTKMNCSDAG